MVAQEMTLELARSVLDRALAKAAEKEIPSTVAVVDAGGHCVAKARMDRVPLVTVRMAEDKAYTAAMLNEATSDLAEPSQPGGPIYGLASAEAGRVIIFGGGIPLRAGDRLVGAVGVAGDAVEDDIEIAEAGVAAWAEAVGADR